MSVGSVSLGSVGLGVVSVGAVSVGAVSVGIVIVAAGGGSRLGASVPKAFVSLGDEPLLWYAVRGALACPDISQVVVVAPAGHLVEARAVAAAAARGRDVTVVAGGDQRTDSVAVGLRALPGGCDVVLVHDAARCLTPAAVFERVIAGVRAGAGAVVPGIPLIDTVKAVGADRRVTSTPERGSLRAIQTPQGFARDVLERAHRDPGPATDDAAMVERLGETVMVVDGHPLAFKVTTTLDLALAHWCVTEGRDLV